MTERKRINMLTVRDALALPVFAPAKLVAGEAGLDNEIHWVHVVDMPDAHFEWNRSGVLLLTAGYGLRDDPARQAALVPRLAERGFAGMVLSTGHYFEHAPDVMRQHADELAFPLIETPPDLLFIGLTEEVLERIVNQQYLLLQQSTEIHTRLTELVLQDGTLDDLAQRLASLLGRAITIEDSSFRVLASAAEGAVDAARERSVAAGRTTPEVATQLLQQGIYDQLATLMAPLQVPPLPELGMTMERIVAPIIVAQELYGYIWIIAGDQPLTPLDEMAIGNGATVAALILFKEQAVREAGEALRGDFLEQLLQGVERSAAFVEQARRLGYRPEQQQQVWLIHVVGNGEGSTRWLQEEVTDWLVLQNQRATPIWRDNRLVILLEETEAGQGAELAQALVEELSHPVGRLLVGVGNIHPPAANAVAHSFEEAQEALSIGLTLGQDEGVVSFNELGLLHWLYHLPEGVAENNVYRQHILALATYDAEREAELLETLEAYLDCGGSLVDAAQALYVHRNTLLHRIQRIEQLRGVDLRDPLQQLNLHVALKQYRLHS